MVQTLEQGYQYTLSLWRAILAPVLAMPDDDARQASRQLAQTLAALIIGDVVLLLVLLAVGRTAAGVQILMVLLEAVFLIAFHLNLRGFPGWAARLTIAITNIAVFVMWSLTASGLNNSTLNYLVLVLFLSSRLLLLREVVAISVINLLTMIIVNLVSPQTDLSSAIVFNALFSVVVIMITNSRLRDVQRVRESEKRYRDLMEVNYEPIAITDPDGRILNVNSAFEGLSGVRMAQLVGRPVTDLLATDSVDYLRGRWGRRGTEFLRLNAINQAEEVFPIETRTSTQIYKGKPALVILVRNLTHESAMEREKREFELRYRAIFENSSDGVFVMEMNGSIVSANQHGMEMMGVTEAEYRQMKSRDFIVPEQHDEAGSLTKRLVEGETVPVYMRRFRRKNGEIFAAEVTSMLVRDMLGNPLYIQSIVRDITQRQRMEASRLALVVQQQRTILLRQLIDDFSHYVRTPLASIKNSSYLLQRVSDAGKQQYHSEVIHLEIDRLVTLLDDLLTLTRIEPEAESQTLTPVEVNDLLRDIIPSPTGKGVLDQTHDWQFRPSRESLILFGNRSRLADVFKRLFANASSYTPAGGRIIVAAQMVPILNAICVTVADTGMGIAPEDLSQIFDTFYRSDAAHAINPLSSGLGLSISRRIVEMHRGVITVDSTLGAGSRFYVWLPTDLTVVLTPEKLAATPVTLEVFE